jgi:predicted permease
MAPLICLFHAVAVTVVSGFLFRKEIDHDKGIARMASVGFNIGLFAYPIIYGLFGPVGLSIAAMLDFGNAFVVFGLSYFLGYMYSGKRVKGKLRFREFITLFVTSVPFMSYLIALGMNLTGLRFTGLPSDVIGVLAQANTGMALIVLGLTLDFSFDSCHWKLIAKVLGLRYIAGLTVGIFLYFLLPFPLVYRTVILFGLTLPVMMAVIPYSVEFSYDTRVAGTIANFTMIISFALMWIFMIFMGGMH